MRKFVAVGLLVAASVIPTGAVAAADPVTDQRVQVLEVEVDTYAVAETIARISTALFTPQSAVVVGTIGAAVANPILDFTANLLGGN